MKTQHPLLGPLGLSLLGIGIVALVIVVEVPAIIGSTGTALGKGAPEQDSVSDILSQHELAMNMDRDRFNGRSFFYVPSPPPRRAPAVERPTAAPPPPPPPPPKVDPKPPAKVYPRNYTGPPLKGIIGATAFFRPSGGGLLFVTVGETRNKIELLGTEPPRSIEVKYDGGGPYTVELFDMAEPDFLSGDDIDDERAARDIITEVRDEALVDPALAEGVGWPAGTTAGDDVRVVYRDGLVERAVSGTLTRANAAWLVLETGTPRRLIELYKRDIRSIQNLSTPVPTSASANDNATDLPPSMNDNTSSEPGVTTDAPSPPSPSGPPADGDPTAPSPPAPPEVEADDLRDAFTRQLRDDRARMMSLGERPEDVEQRIKIFRSWIQWWQKLPDVCREEKLPAADELQRMITEQELFLRDFAPSPPADEQSPSLPPASPEPSPSDG